MPLQYEDFARQISPEKLKQELDAMHNNVELHLLAISKELDKLEEVAAQLGLPNRIVTDAEANHRDPDEQRYERADGNNS